MQAGLPVMHVSEIPESNWRLLLGREIYYHYTNLAQLLQAGKGDLPAQAGILAFVLHPQYSYFTIFLTITIKQLLLELPNSGPVPFLDHQGNHRLWEFQSKLCHLWLLILLSLNPPPHKNEDKIDHPNRIPLI